MDDDRIVISSGFVVTPETVASRNFTTAFRGFDQGEVRAFLKRVSEELIAAAEREAQLRRLLQEAQNKAAHPEVDEELLTSALGEHAARLLASAREQAAEIRGEAEARAGKMLRDAEHQISRVRSEADSLLARRVDEVDGVTANLRNAAEADARALREKARADAEAEIQAAKAQGREMVQEARAIRERILADLARRRHISEVQLDQLRAARERLLEAYSLVRRTLDEATKELKMAEVEARLAADEAGRRAGPPPPPPPPPTPPRTGLDVGPQTGEHQAVPVPPATGAGGAVAPPPAAHARPGADAFPSPPGPPPSPAPEPAVAAPAGATASATGAPVDAGPATGAAAPGGTAPGASAAPRPAATRVRPTREPSPRPDPRLRPPTRPSDTRPSPGWRRTGGPEGPARPDSPPGEGLLSRRPPAPEPPSITPRPVPPPPARLTAAPAPVTPPAPPATPATPADRAGAEAAPEAAPKPADQVEALFARIKADRASEVAKTSRPLFTPPDAPAAEITPPPPTPTPPPSAKPAEVVDESARTRRDELLEPAESSLVRQLKRALQDEQNEVLDHLRRQRRPTAASVLPSAVDQVSRFRDLATPALADAVRAGARFAGRDLPGTDAEAEADREVAATVAAALASAVVEPLRARLERQLPGSEAEAGSADTAQLGEAVSAAYRQWRAQELEPLARHHAADAFGRGSFAAYADGTALRWVVDDEAPCPDCDDNELAGGVSKGESYPTGQPHPPAHPGCRCLLVPAVP